MTQRPSWRPSPVRLIVGGLIIVAGVVWFLVATGVVDVPLRAILPVALIVIGVVLVATSGRPHGALIVIGVVLTVVLAVGTVVLPSGGSFETGDRVRRPASVADLEPSYELGIGSLHVDLSRVALPPGDTHVRAQVGVGELVVVVPRDVGIRAEGRAGTGVVDLLGRSSSGFGVDDDVVDDADARSVLVVEASVGTGRVEIRRSSRPAPTTSPTSSPEASPDLTESVPPGVHTEPAPTAGGGVP